MLVIYVIDPYVLNFKFFIILVCLLFIAIELAITSINNYSLNASRKWTYMQ